MGEIGAGDRLGKLVELLLRVGRHVAQHGEGQALVSPCLLVTAELPYDGFVVLVPSAPLAAGKTYTAAFEATLKSGATPLVRSVSFTTAP